MLLIFLLLFPQMIVWPNAAAKSTISFGEANSIKTNGPVKEETDDDPKQGKTVSVKKKSSDWGYMGNNGPDYWPGICQSGIKQSPVNFGDPIYQEVDQPLKLENYEIDPWIIKLINNGHTLQAEFQSKEGQEPTISGGGLNGTYLFAQLHFHWGAASDRGSEHTVDDSAYPLELHLVHYNKRYKSISEAANKPDGLAVLGVFFQLTSGDEDNQYIDRLLEGVPYVKNGPEERRLPRVLRLSYLVPWKTNDFFRYQGSLTTPPCYESVTWTVFTESLKIGEAQMAQLRSLRVAKTQSVLSDNFRPTRPLNARKVFVTKGNYNSSETAPKSIKRERYDPYHEKPEETDHFFLLIMSIIIFFMQCGFAFMEAGAVRSKNTVNILIKNWLDMCIGALVYWAVGFAITFGGSDPFLSPFMGTSYFFFIGMPGRGGEALHIALDAMHPTHKFVICYKLSKWFFQFVFAATAATLVSGSLAERCNFIAYIVYSVMITGFIYPMIAHWTWHREGWLRIYGYHDFAGSGVVHLTGAVCALVGCILMGPRIGRFDKDGQPVSMPGHSVPLSALGGLILIFGFFACNGTKQGSISHPGDGIAIATAIVNTALGTSAAGIATLIFNKTGIVPGTGGNYSFLVTMNGSLTGTVALCAGCNVFEAWASVVVGALSGPLFLFFKYVLLRLNIDDPLDAIPVHGVGGLWGTLSVYIFMKNGILMTWSSSAFWGLAWNCIGLVTIICWTGATCFVMFIILKTFKMLRVETGDEFKGMDLLKHGESAYPADAWVEAQYMKDGDMGAEIDEEGMEDNGQSGQDQGKTKKGLPPNMKFSRSASYNNPHQMFPSASKLFSGMNSVAGNVTINPSSRKTSTLTKLSEEGTEEEKSALKK